MKEFVRGVLAEAARHDGPPQEPTPRRMGEGRKGKRYFSPVETCRSCGAALKTLFNTFDDLVFQRLQNRLECLERANQVFWGVAVVVGSRATLPFGARGKK